MTDDTSGGDLTRTLRERADAVVDAPLTFGDVRGRARQIQRRRVAGAAGGLALVAAVLLPIALLGGSGTDRSEPDPAKPSPTKAIDPLAGGVPTLQDGVIIYPDGPRVPLRIDPSEIRAFTPLWTDRYVVSTFGDDGTKIALLDEVGNGVDHFPTDGGSLAVATDRSAVAWMGPDGSPQLLVAGSDEPRSLGRVPGRTAALVAITGDCRSECEVIGRIDGQGGGLGSSWAASTTGAVRDLPAAVPAVVDATSDGSLVGGLDGLASDDIHACGGVYDVATSAFLFHNCEDNIYRFSPGGTFVATTFAEGLGPTGIAIRDARSGAVVASLDDVGWVSDFAWEDDQHLLAVIVADDGATRLERVGPDGNEVVLDGFYTEDPTLGVPIQLPVS